MDIQSLSEAAKKVGGASVGCARRGMNVDSLAAYNSASSPQSCNYWDPSGSAVLHQEKGYMPRIKHLHVLCWKDLCLRALTTVKVWLPVHGQVGLLNQKPVVLWNLGET